ncbi:MAG: CDP-alcohol phosphatidyltransferase family protein [bacterium]|nr:CDP-alcohol phosphatidyltransferase family protein [bacterium]
MEAENKQSPGFTYEKSLKKRQDNSIDKYIRVEKYINRPLAALLVRAVFNTGITPNGLTYCNFVLGIAAAILLAQDTYLFILLGGISIQLSAIVDCADGQLARAKDMCSDYGSHLDIFLDRITDFCLVVGVSVGLYGKTGNIDFLIYGFLAAGLYLLQVNLFYIINSLLKKKETGSTGEARALMLFAILVFSVAYRLEFFLYLLMAETTVVCLLRFIQFVRMGKAAQGPVQPDGSAVEGNTDVAS